MEPVPQPNTEIKTIRKIISDINNAWQKGHTERLKECFHQKMIMVAPDLTVLGEGREACIKSYVDFIGQAKIRRYSQSEPDIKIWGNTAVASYRYQMAWEMEGKSHDESGRDLFVFTFKEGRWLAVWRKLIPDAVNR